VTESLVNQLFKDHTVYTPSYKFRFCILGVKIWAKSVNFFDLKVTEPWHTFMALCYLVLPCATLCYLVLPCATLSYLGLPWATLGYLGLPWAAMGYLSLHWASLGVFWGSFGRPLVTLGFLNTYIGMGVPSTFVPLPILGLIIATY
jgi:hypothetical protein